MLEGKFCHLCRGPFDFQGDSSYNIRHRYSVNQGEDVWSQLLYGIRYLDLRVGHYTNTPEKFWIGT